MIRMMFDDVGGPVTVAVGDFTVLVARQPPALFGDYLSHADVVDDFSPFDERSSNGYLLVGVGDGDWPKLVITQRFSPATSGFSPGIIFVAETGTLFLGAGTRLLGYRLDQTGSWRRLFVDETEIGFWAWRQHGDHVIMSGELELAGWTIGGEKLWSTFVEPPWSYRVDGGEVHLDVMGKYTAFDIYTGPAT